MSDKLIDAVQPLVEKLENSLTDLGLTPNMVPVADLDQVTATLRETMASYGCDLDDPIQSHVALNGAIQTAAVVLTGKLPLAQATALCMVLRYFLDKVLEHPLDT